MADGICINRGALPTARVLELCLIYIGNDIGVSFACHTDKRCFHGGGEVSSGRLRARPLSSEGRQQ